MKIDTKERQLRQSVDLGEWKSVGGGEPKRTRYRRYAKATLLKDRRLTISLSRRDFVAIQKRALAEGVSWRTLVWKVLHEYASGRLREIPEVHSSKTSIASRKRRGPAPGA
jgi:predicted DNA binding CopG/RHH family protein